MWLSKGQKALCMCFLKNSSVNSLGVSDVPAYVT